MWSLTSRPLTFHWHFTTSCLHSLRSVRVMTRAILCQLVINLRQAAAAAAMFMLYLNCTCTGHFLYHYICFCQVIIRRYASMSSSFFNFWYFFVKLSVILLVNDDNLACWERIATLVNCFRINVPFTVWIHGSRVSFSLSNGGRKTPETTELVARVLLGLW